MIVVMGASVFLIVISVFTPLMDMTNLTQL